LQAGRVCGEAKAGRQPARQGATQAWESGEKQAVFRLCARREEQALRSPNGPGRWARTSC
jgi:hypothetical protein